MIIEKLIMNNQIFTLILSFYGLFLISCGITAVSFIGLKAKTALVSGGTSGCVALIIAYLVSKNNDTQDARLIGIFLALALFVVFSWRTTKTLFSLFEMIPQAKEGLKGKGIAFLIIGLMAIVSLGVFTALVILNFI